MKNPQPIDENTRKRLFLKQEMADFDARISANNARIATIGSQIGAIFRNPLDYDLIGLPRLIYLRRERHRLIAEQLILIQERRVVEQLQFRLSREYAISQGAHSYCLNQAA